MHVTQLARLGIGRSREVKELTDFSVVNTNTCTRESYVWTGQEFVLLAPAVSHLVYVPGKPWLLGIQPYPRAVHKDGFTIAAVLGV